MIGSKKGRCPAPLAVLALLGLILPFLPATAGAAQTDSAARLGAEQPNIVLILLDDLETRSLELMPNVVTLLEERGVSFSNYFVSTPTCCPSRASLLRGQYPHNHGVLKNGGPQGGFATFQGLNRESSTAAVWLQDVGYRTALLGKYLNGYPQDADPTYVPPGWDEWYATIRGGFFNYQLNENGQIVRYGESPEEYSTDVLAAKATDFVRRAAPADQPFFLYLAPHAPHGDPESAPRHAEALADAVAPRVPSFNEADVRDKPRWVQQSPLLGAEEITEIDALYRNRVRSLLAVDELVTDLVAALDAADALDNTFVFFTSDNGFQVGEHRRTAKGMPYDESIRVPLLVRGPGVPAGHVEERLAFNIDLAPTIAALGGTKAPRFVDGRSLAPLLVGDPAPEAWRQAGLIEWLHPVATRRQLAELKQQDDGEAEPDGGSRGVPTFTALRAADVLYVEYATGERELYDLNTDPYQLENLAEGAEPDRLARLSEQLKALQDCAAASCRAVEDEPLDLFGGSELTAQQPLRTGEVPSDRRASRTREVARAAEGIGPEGGTGSGRRGGVARRRT